MLSVVLLTSMSMANKRVMTQMPNRSLQSQAQMMKQSPVTPGSVKFAEAEDEPVTENEEYLAYCSEDVLETWVGKSGTVSAAAYFPAGIVKRLIGNELTGIATQIWDDNATNVHLWVARSLDEEPFINVKLTDGFETFTPIKVTFEEAYTIVEEGLYIGITMDCPDEGTACFACDWYDRDNAFYYKAPNEAWQDWSHAWCGSLYILGITTGDKMFSNEDVEVRNVTSNRALINSEVENSLNFYNYGKSAVTSIEIEYTINGETKNATIEWDEWNAVTQFSSGGVIFSVSTPEKEGYQDIKYKIVKVNGMPNSDNGSSCGGYIICLEESFPRTILVEQTESTEDDWAAVANLAMKTLNDKYADNAIGIAVHQEFPYYGNSELCCETYAPFSNLIGYPYAEFINRKYIDYAYETYYDEYDPQSAFRLGKEIDKLSVTATEGKISLNAQYTNEESMEIRFDSDVVFNYDSEKDVPYRVAYILVESEVYGYSMLNRYNYDYLYNDIFYGDDWEFDYYWSTTPPELKALGDLPFEIEGEPYLNVARGIYDCFGVEGSLVGNIVKDEVKKHTYTVSVPESVADKSKLYAVAVLLDGYSGEAINVVKCEISDYSGVAAVEGGNNVSISVENGNPFVKTNAAATVEVYNLAGQKLASMAVEGSAAVPVDTTDSIVIVRAVTGKDVTVKRVVLK